MQIISPASQEAKLFSFTDISTFSDNFTPSPNSLENVHDPSEQIRPSSDWADLAIQLQSIGITNLTVGNMAENELGELEIDYAKSGVYVWRDSNDTECWLCLPLEHLTSEVPFFNLIPPDQHALIYFQSVIPFNLQMSMTISGRRYVPFVAPEFVEKWDELKGQAFPVVFLTCGNVLEGDCVPWVITPKLQQTLHNTFNRLAPPDVPF